jgi:hypothetical protein
MVFASLISAVGRTRSAAGDYTNIAEPIGPARNVAQTALAINRYARQRFPPFFAT